MTAHFVICKYPFIFNILALLSSSQVVLVVKNPSADPGDAGLIPGSGRFPRRTWQSTPVFLPGESPRTGEPDGIQSIGSQRVIHDRSGLAQHTQFGSSFIHTHTHTHTTQYSSICVCVCVYSKHSRT